MVVASLPMYDFAEVRGATDAMWQCIARHLRNEGIKQVPPKLAHDVPLKSLWSDDNLFFSQCCGYDVVHTYKRRLQLLGTPCFTAPGCAGGDYASTIVVQEDSLFRDVRDMFGTIAVVNGPESHSGTNALFGLVGPYARQGKFFSRVKISGTHAASLETLRAGGADVASIDCLTYALLKRYRASIIEGTRPLGLTYAAPAPPYVTQATIDAETIDRMKTALLAAFIDPESANARQALLLSSVETGSTQSYQRISSEFRHNLRAI